MKFEKLWHGYRFPKCENCNKECNGRLDYENLCSNLNYLKEYAEKNYEKNKESFEELSKITNQEKLNIFSFGCGLGLDYVGAKEVFNNFNYYGIDETDWAIKKTENYKSFEPKLPKTMKYDDGMFMLSATRENPVICFFNSLFTISNNADLEKDLLDSLSNKDKFYLVCDYTINNNYHMPSEEQDFIDKLLKELKSSYNFKCFDILDGRGIIVVGNKN